MFSTDHFVNYCCFPSTDPLRYSSQASRQPTEKALEQRVSGQRLRGNNLTKVLGQEENQSTALFQPDISKIWGKLWEQINTFLCLKSTYLQSSWSKFARVHKPLKQQGHETNNKIHNTKLTDGVRG